MQADDDESPTSIAKTADTFEARNILHALLVLNSRYLIKEMREMKPTDMASELGRVSGVLDFMDCLEEMLRNMIAARELALLPKEMLKSGMQNSVRIVKVYYFEDSRFAKLPADISSSISAVGSCVSSAEQPNGKKKSTTAAASADISLSGVLQKIQLTDAKLFKDADLVLSINDSYAPNLPTEDDSLPKPLISICGSNSVTSSHRRSKSQEQSPTQIGITEALAGICGIYSQRLAMRKKLRARRKRMAKVQRVGNILFYPNSVLGYGITGTTVYRGLFQERKVAVKKIPLQLHEIVASEISTMLKADSHPNIGRYFAKEQDGVYAYLAIEYCKGSLQDLIQMYTLPLDKRNDSPVYELFGGGNETEIPRDLAMRIIREIMEGLAYLHRIRVVHKNLKPTNILFNSEKIIKLSDVGISKRVGADMSKNSENWQAAECLTYEDYDAPADIFSLGCVIYYLMTSGKHPFASSENTIRVNILSGRPNLTSVSNFDSRYLVSQMICKDPAQRFDILTCKNYIFFWEDAKVLTFIGVISATVCSLGLWKEFNKIASEFGLLAHCPQPGWNKMLHYKIVQESMRSGSNYRFDSAADLVRLMRNINVHYRELQASLQLILGDVPSGFLRYFMLRFPKLPTVLYRFAVKYRKSDYQVNAFIS